MNIRSKTNAFSSGRRDALRKCGALSAAPVIAALSRPGFAQAQAYPAKTIRVLIGYSAGGSGDIMARLVAENLRPALGQTVIVENRPGASGNIAAQLSARAPADGYTLFLGSTAEMVINKFIMKDMGFNPEADFLPVIQIYNIPLALVVQAKSPHTSLNQLLAEARRNPGKVSFASAGSGSPGHIAGEMLALKANAPMTHVPYKGAAPALTDLVGGHVSCYLPD